MNDQKRKEMAAIVDAFDDNYRRGLMDADLYARSNIVLAHEYMTGGEQKLAVDVLRRCPLQYFKTAHAQHMADDVRFERVAYDLARMLESAGLTEEVAADGVAFTQFGLGKA